MKTTLLRLIVPLAFMVSVAGADKPFGLWCTIDGEEVQFVEGAKAISAQDGGLSLIAHKGRTWVCITVPKPRSGVQRLADTPGLAVDYTRDVFSSDSRASYSARSTIPNTSVEVALSRVGAGDGVVVGEFSADVSSFPPTRTLHISKGKFRLKISDNTAQREQKSAQPAGAANRSQPSSPEQTRTPTTAGSGR